MITRPRSETAETPADENGFAALDDEPFPTFERGSVWLAGAGPGAPGLLSLLAYHALRRADAIVYDALVNPAALRWARPDAAFEYSGKRGGRPSPHQRDISRRLIELAREGKRTLRLKGGDPFMFGRGGEECLALRDAQIPFRVIPGITAAVAALGYAGLPATHRDVNHSVTFLTGHDADGGAPEAVDWNAVADASPVIAMYMALRNLPEIAEKLLAAGRPDDENVVVVSNASLPHQSVVTARLRDVAQQFTENPPPAPAVVVIGVDPDGKRAFPWFDLSPLG